MASERLLALRAGPFRLGLPLVGVRQILDAGGEKGGASHDPRALGVEPVPLASVLGAMPETLHPALLLFDGHGGPVLLSTCALEGVVEAEDVRPLPETVLIRWPGLFSGTGRDAHGLILLTDPQVLIGVVESYSSRPDERYLNVPDREVSDGQ